MTFDLHARRAAAKVVAADAAKCAMHPEFWHAGTAAVNDAGIRFALALVADFFGANLVVSEDSAAATCQKVVAKGTGKLLDGHLKLYRNCFKSGLRNGAIDDAPGLEDCVAAVATQSSITKLAARLATRTAAKCATTNQAATFPGRCAVGPTELTTCVAERVRCRAWLIVNHADALQVDCDAYDDGRANVP
jgi:hypothetical protein